MRGMLVLALCMPLSACASRNVESALLTELDQSGADASTIDILRVAQAPADAMYTVVCPYESREAIEERISISSAELPDYTMKENLQALIIVIDGAVASVGEFSRTRVDLCAALTFDQLTDQRLRFEKKADVWQTVALSD